MEEIKMKEKNWEIWLIGGLVCNFLLLCFNSIVLKLLFLVLECVCYGILWYKLLKKEENEMKEIEIPFGAHDSELKGWEYTIPEGMEAEIKDGKIVVREKESEDERIRKGLIGVVSDIAGGWPFENHRITKKEAIAYLENQKPLYNLEIPAGDVAPAEEDGPFDEDEFLENELSAFLQDYDMEYYDDAVVSDAARHFYEIGKKQKEQKPIDLHDKIEELCSEYPINKYSVSDEELSAYHQGVHLGATKIAEYLSKQKPAESSSVCLESEHDKGYREGVKYALRKTEQYTIGSTFMGLIPCWVNAPSELQPAHKYHGRNAVVMHENNGGFRCCFIDDKEATTVHLPEDTMFVEGWRKKPADEAKDFFDLAKSYGDRKLPQLAKVKATGKIVNIIHGTLSIGNKSWIAYSSDKEDGYKIYSPDELFFLDTEQKPADRFEEAREKYQVEWNEEDEAVYDAFMCEVVNEKMNPTVEQVKWLRGIRDRFKSLRPVKQEWSEEDRDKVAQYLHDRDGGMLWAKATEITSDILDILRPSWKPSEEQIYSLGTVVKGYEECTVGSVGYHLKEMYEQLKKLM